MMMRSLMLRLKGNWVVGDKYEVLDNLREEANEATLSVSYTPNNGIRIQILDDTLAKDWAVFDLNAEQAELVGRALIRFAEDDRT